MYLKNSLGIVLLPSLLVACNNDGTSTLAESAYTGSLTEASLTTDSANTFTSSAFAARESSLSASSLSSLLPDATTKQTRGKINTTKNCSNGGTAIESGEVDDTTKLGSITTTFSNCLIQDTLINGVTDTVVTAYDLSSKMPTAVIITYDKLSMAKAGETITLIGTLEATQDNTTTHLIVKTHLQSASGKQVLLDMRTDVTANANYTASSTFTGKVCVDDQGCTTISTVSPFIIDYNGVLTAGNLITTGINNSQAQVNVLANNRIQIDVDKNGDSIYEDQQVFTN
jgi:hypothetical protein